MENKKWTIVAQFSSYEEADILRNELALKHELVKVKRGSKAYRVKVWDPPEEKEAKNKNTKRSKKNGKGNKKVHN